MNPSLIFLPALAYFLLSLAFTKIINAEALFESLVKAHLVIFTFIAVYTEGLSFFSAIYFPSILIGWLLFLSACAAALAWRYHAGGWTLPAFRKISPFFALILGSIIFLLVTTFAAALLYPPNTWDSLTYHLARVVHWIQNKRVSFYPTAITRQLYQMPLAEYGILHLQLLSGGDRFAGMIQWVGYVVSISLAALTAAEFGLDKRRQLISAAIMASTPMAILQASSTQNDMIVSSFLFSFAFFLLRLIKKQSAENVLFAALAFGCALLTKGTAFIFSAGIGSVLGIALLIKHKADARSFWRAAASLALIVGVGLTLSASHLWRNYRVYGNPLSTESEDYSNKDLSLQALGGNMLRNAAQHLGTPFEGINAAEYRVMEKILGPELDNPETTWLYSTFNISYSREETTTGNLPQILFMLAGIIVLPVYWIRAQYSNTIGYAMGVSLAAILYCWFINWQTWGSRLHTPLFAISAPLFAIIISGGDGFGKRFGNIVTTLALLYAIPFAVSNENRPLFPPHWREYERAKLYFLATEPKLFNEYTAAIKEIGDFKGEVGLLSTADSCEYPLWVMTGQTVPHEDGMTFHNVGVENVSAKIVDNPQPEYVISLEVKQWQDWRKYDVIYESENVRVYRKK